MVFIKVMSGSEKNNDETDKAIKTENLVRAAAEMSCIIYKYGFNVSEALGLLSAMLMKGFEQQFKEWHSLESIKNIMDGLPEKMYHNLLKKITKTKEK